MPILLWQICRRFWPIVKSRIVRIDMSGFDLNQRDLEFDQGNTNRILFLCIFHCTRGIFKIMRFCNEVFERNRMTMIEIGMPISRRQWWGWNSYIDTCRPFQLLRCTVWTLHTRYESGDLRPLRKTNFQKVSPPNIIQPITIYYAYL